MQIQNNELAQLIKTTELDRTENDKALFENKIVSQVHVAGAAANKLNCNLSFDGSDWLNAVEAAMYLRIFRKNGSPCVERIRNLVNQGKIPFYKPYGRLLFKKSELRSLVESSRKGGFLWR